MGGHFSRWRRPERIPGSLTRKQIANMNPARFDRSANSRSITTGTLNLGGDLPVQRLGYGTMRLLASPGIGPDGWAQLESHLAIGQINTTAVPRSSQAFRDERDVIINEFGLTHKERPATFWLRVSALR